MKKNVLTKGILVLLVIALLTMGFTGCGTVPPACTTATVIIDIQNDSYSYWIDIDGVYWDTTDGSGNLTLYNVPIGNHTFYAEATDYLFDGYAYNIYISCPAINYVTIPVY